MNTGIAIERKNLKSNDISHYMMGYENLGFKQIRELLLESLGSITIFPAEVISIKGRKTIPIPTNGTSGRKPQGNPSGTISLQEYIQKQVPTERTSPLTILGETSMIPTNDTSTGKPSETISFQEYVQKQVLTERPKPLSILDGTSMIPAKSLDPDARHSSQSQQAASNGCPPSKEISIDPTVVWIILYMIHLTLTKPLKHDNRPSWFDTFTSIGSRELFEVFKSRRKIKHAKDIATASKILLRFGHTPNKYVDKFKINIKRFPLGSLGKLIAHTCVNSEVNTMLADAYERKHSKHKMDDVTQYALRIIKTLRIRKKEALEFIEANYQQERDQLVSLNKLTVKAQERLDHSRDRDVAYVKMVDQVKDFAYAKRDTFGGRMHTLFTQSPKRLRKFLYFQGVPDDLFILDLGNAQPLLLVLTLMEKYQQTKWGTFHFEIDKVPTFLQLLRKYGGNEDVIRYITLVQEGKLYEEMHKLLIAAQFRDVKPVFDLCVLYINAAQPTEQEAPTLIGAIHPRLRQIRQLLRLDIENEKTQRVLKNLRLINKRNLSKHSIINVDFVLGLHNAIARAYNSEMTKERKRKIKTDLCRHVFYGMLDGQHKKVKNPQPLAVAVKKRKPYPVLIKRAFGDSFPNVWDVVEDVKRFDYTDLAKILHGKEANIFVDHVLRYLIVKERKPHFQSLHDGILCTKDDVKLLMDRIAYEFSRWGMQAPLNIENITTGLTTTVILNRQTDVFKQRFIECKKDGKMARMYAKAS